MSSQRRSGDVGSSVGASGSGAVVAWAPNMEKVPLEN
jgi:hypothetical protein